jgi:hypothetical protein
MDNRQHALFALKTIRKAITWAISFRFGTGLAV